eukprot:7448465-Pyramimonas_sp.AAC.1
MARFLRALFHGDHFDLLDLGHIPSLHLRRLNLTFPENDGLSASRSGHFNESGRPLSFALADGGGIALSGAPLPFHRALRLAAPVGLGPNTSCIYPTQALATSGPTLIRALSDASALNTACLRALNPRISPTLRSTAQ